MSDSELIYFDRIETSIGDLILALGTKGLQYVSFHNLTGKELSPSWIYSPSRLYDYTSQMKEYLTGKRKSFDMPLAPLGTDFQCRVWQMLTEIPYGETITYGELASNVGNPKAMRAVGNANGRNPIVIIQPCHRVVAANAKIGGFSAGIYRKRFLLGLEKGVKTLF